jgi:hypothetical protein
MWLELRVEKKPGPEQERTVATPLVATSRSRRGLIPRRSVFRFAAKRDAMPSDEHIDRVRYLIRRMREKIDGLPEHDAREVHRILGSQANDRRELGDLTPAAFQLNVIAIDPSFDPELAGA